MPVSHAKVLEALIINRQPWDPLPGQRKYRCSLCDFDFASSEAREWCHDCEERERRKEARMTNLDERKDAEAKRKHGTWGMYTAKD